MRGDLGLSVAFFLSGVAGLVFQIVWFYQCGLVFGSSIASVTVVLSSFMGGLALGNLLAGLYGTRQPRLLVTYSALEVLVAVSGLVVTTILPHLPILLVPLTRTVGAVPSAVHLLRFAFAFVVLVVPATAMGATLPVLVGALLVGSDDVKQRIATASTDESPAVEYARGLQALSRRDFASAATSLRRADAQGLQSPLPRALLVYVLCLMDRHQEAQAAASDIRPQNADENHFWTWIGRTFNVGPMCTRC